jgi:hypothetical protein
MFRRPKSFPVKSRQKSVVAFSAVVALLLGLVLYSDVPRFANAGAEKFQGNEVAVGSTQGSSPGCCAGDEGNNKPHLLAGSYYTINNNFSAKLLLNNKGPLPIEVQPTLFSLSGERFDAPPITVASNSHRFEDFGDWAAVAGEQFREGSIQVFHRGKDLVLGTQIYLIDETHSLSFDEKLTELGKPGSPRLEGVWWLPSPKGAISLVLSNTSDTILSVSTTIRGEAPKRETRKREANTTVDVAPHETKVLDIERDLLRKERGALPSFGAIAIEHTGGPRALLARGMAQDASRGYSLPIQFVDPGAAKSNNLQGAGLRIGKAGKEYLSPKVVAHNASETETTLNGRVPYTTADGINGEIILPQVQLGPGETEIIDVAQHVKTHGVAGHITAAGLEFQYTGELGSVITSAFSVSRSANQVFRVPLWDIAAQRSATGGYPWYIEDGSSTTVYIKNVTDQPRQYRLYLMFASGVYSHPLTTVAPGQTTALDVRALRDNQVPDVNGQTIPLGETRGQVQWSMTGGEDKVLIGRAEQADLVRGVSTNYSCVNCCGNSFYDGWVTPGEATGFEGDEMEYFAMQQDANCYGQVFPAFEAGLPNFNSGLPSICDFFLGGRATGIGPGQTGIQAHWTADSWFMGLNEQCQYTPVEALREALCSILAVEFLEARLVGTNRVAGFVINRASLNINTCGGDRFAVKATFQLPPNSASCCSNTTTNFVSLSSNNRFEFAPSLIDGTIYDFFGDDTPPYVIFYLRTRSDGGGSTSSANISVGGQYQDGTSYSGQGTVNLTCE